MLSKRILPNPLEIWNESDTRANCAPNMVHVCCNWIWCYQLKMVTIRIKIKVNTLIFMHRKIPNMLYRIQLLSSHIVVQASAKHWIITRSYKYTLMWYIIDFLHRWPLSRDFCHCDGYLAVFRVHFRLLFTRSINFTYPECCTYFMCIKIEQSLDWSHNPKFIFSATLRPWPISHKISMFLAHSICTLLLFQFGKQFDKLLIDNFELYPRNVIEIVFMKYIPNRNHLYIVHTYTNGLLNMPMT